MWQSSDSKSYPGLARQPVGRVWTDVNRWPGWRFTVRPQGGPLLRLRLESVQPSVCFTDVTLLPRARGVSPGRSPGGGAG